MARPKLPRDHFSVSQSDMYARCPEQYRRRYVEGHVSPPGIALVVGSSVHQTAEANHRHKLKKGADIALDTMHDIAQEAFKSRLEEQDLFLPPEDKGHKRRVVKAGEKKTHSLVDVYGRRFAPTVEPQLVEERDRMKLPGLCDVVYIIDLLDRRSVLHELKTAGRKPNQDTADRHLQLTFYALALQAQRSISPRLQYDALVCPSSGNTSYVALKTRRTQEDFDAVLRRFTTQVRAISAGLFPPCDPTSWICSPRFCGYWSTCPYVSHRFDTRKDG